MDKRSNDMSLTEQQIFEDYLDELRECRKDKTKPVPLHLFSKQVYRAYRNAWRFINRKKLTVKEMQVMLQLGIYKPSVTEIGARSLDVEGRKEACKIRYGYSILSY
jgi:hypothetical protein